MKIYDDLTLALKKIQQKNLSVYILEQRSIYTVKATKGISLHTFNSREKAVEFCRYLELPIVAYVKDKNG